jgi:hypothetical protein
VGALVFTQALRIPVGIDFLDALLLGSRQLGKVILDGLLLGLPGATLSAAGGLLLHHGQMLRCW